MNYQCYTELTRVFFIFEIMEVKPITMRRFWKLPNGKRLFPLLVNPMSHAHAQCGSNALGARRQQLRGEPFLRAGLAEEVHQVRLETMQVLTLERPLLL